MHQKEEQIIGMRLRQMRKSLGLTQAQMASIMGISMQQWYKFEKGHNRISATLLYRASKFSHRPIAWFFQSADEEGHAEVEQAIDQYFEGIKRVYKQQQIGEAVEALMGEG